MEKKMENSKLGFKKYLGAIIANAGIWLTALILSVCFFAPVTKVKALTKDQIVNDYNISFVSAKTRVRKATSIDRYTLTGKKVGAQNNTFYKYLYDYDSTLPNYYYTKSANDYSNESSIISLQTNDNQDLYYHPAYDNTVSSLTTNFIPTHATHFINSDGYLEEIFYDEIDNGDFALINNYRTPISSTGYNVENFYLSFGTPYTNEEEGYKTTPLNDLQVSGKLFNADGEHELVLNGVEHSNNIEEGTSKLASYWYQFFDMQELQAKTTPDNQNQSEENQVYYIDNTEGKYEITFSFIRYNEDLTVGTSRETFTYTFYLIDAANYDNYPTINNAELSVAESGSVNQYYYHFKNDLPYITYDPTRYNIAYTRNNTNISAELTSTLNTGKYTKNNQLYPWHRVSYLKDGHTLKDLYILTWYNNDQTLVSYTYLADMYGENRNDINEIISANNGSISYNAFATMLKDEKLKLEYMSWKELTIDGNKYTTNTYKSDDYKICTADNVLKIDTIPTGLVATSTQVLTKIDDTYYWGDSNADANKIINFKRIKITKENVDINSKLVVNTHDLLENNGTSYDYNTYFVTPGQDDLKNITLTAYEFEKIEDQNKIRVFEKYYKTPQDHAATSEARELDIVNNIATFSQKNLDIKITVISETAMNVEFSYNNAMQGEIAVNTVTTNNENDNYNTKLLNQILNIDHVQIDYSYDLCLEELGRYNLEYKYMVSTNSGTIINTTTNGTNYSDSTNIATPVNYSLKRQFVALESLSPSATTKHYSIILHGALDTSNSVVLNGHTYKYDATTNTVKIDGGETTYNIDEITPSPVVPFANESNTVRATFSIDGTTLYIKIDGNFVSINETKNEIKCVKYGEFTTETYSTITYSLDSIISTNIEGNNWENIENLKTSINSSFASNYTVLEKINSGVQQGRDTLHIFGSIAYFNKDNTHTDNGHSKLQEIDSRMSRNYISDVTKLYSGNGVMTSDKTADSFKGFAKTLLDNGVITKDNLVITDITPVLWNNFSTLAFIQNKRSESRIYRYPNAKIIGDSITGIDKSTNLVETSYFTKDVYCQYDGLYEVVVIYNYDGKPGEKYYQLFTFMIDNSSPTLETYVWKTGTDESDRDNEPLGLNKYTNKNIRLQWEIPTYFKNDVYIDIQKEYFNNTKSQFNYKATYKQNSIINITENTPNYANKTSKMDITTIDNKDYYYVDICLPEDNTNAYDLTGTYNIVVHYNMYGKSTFTQQFIIDTEDISGLIARAVQTNLDENDNKSYSIAIDDFNRNIINGDFTFRYDSKASGAKIYVNYDKIDFETYSNSSQLINATNGIGITTTLAAAARRDDMSVGTPYSYTRDINNPNKVDSKNFLHSNNSAIYLFRLLDDAGNTAQYVVFFDTTTPRFRVSPAITDTTISDTTNVYWGDYKAIKINLDGNQVLDVNKNISNNTEIEDNISDTKVKLETIFSYINKSNRFNNAKVEKIGDDYYILVPVTEVRIKDGKYSIGNQSITLLNNVKTYYFFPKNPVNNDEIELLNDNGIKVNYLLAENPTFTSINDARGKSVERYITAKYYIDDTHTQTAYAQGSIGEGLYSYTVKDQQGNRIQGTLVMNLDKTLVTGYGVFDYSDGIKNAVKLDDATSSIDTGAYAAARIMISSIDSNDIDINPYELTYQYYGYNPSLYSDYYISYAITKEDNEYGSYLELTLKKYKDETDELTARVLIYDTDNAEYPLYSYPYDLQSTAIVADAQGNPTDVYSEGIEYYDNINNRKYSTTINPTTDTVQRKIVTREGLYIFKRTYTELNFDLGNDSKTIYRAFYIDRSGIIQLDSSIGEEISFMLGRRENANDEDPTYLKEITSSTIQNNQKENNNKTSSNADRRSMNLFSTNKVQVEFTSTFDKYNFDKFYQNSYVMNNMFNLLNEDIKTSLLQNTFNRDYFKARYKLDMTVNVNTEYTKSDVPDANVIFAERKDGDHYYGTATNREKYITASSFINATTRSNQIRFIYGNSLKYYITLTDHNGYKIEEKDPSGQIATKDDNACANKLTINFVINHNAPQANAYGKYYGRHNYDENLASDGTLLNSPSIPLDNGNYNLLTKYLQDGQLDPLSNTAKNAYNSPNGRVVQWYSTNNKTLVFVFTITDDEYQAKIDKNNIKIYKNQVSDSTIIFNKTNGQMIGSSLVSKDRMQSAWIENEFNNTKYYAIVIFDDNLDDILDNNKDGKVDDNDDKQYSSFRLLDASQNDDTATYFAELHYIGNPDNYKGQEGSIVYSYYNTTFQIDVDRVKPMYNLTKLMNLDKYVYNTVTTAPTDSNYKNVFEAYAPFYHFGQPTQSDIDNNFIRSDLENYFFAIDYRQATSFEFESIDDKDNVDGFYFRKVNKNDYNFSITPDDYEAYYNATYLQGHPQFTPSNATEIVTSNLNGQGMTILTNTYYHISYTLIDQASKSISANFLQNNNIFEQDNYYEIIEKDEAGNYRVYGVYIPRLEDNYLEFTYQKNSNKSSEVTVEIQFGTNPRARAQEPVNGMNLNFTSYKTKDNFVKAKIEFDSTKLKRTLYLYYSPITESITLTDQSNNVIRTITGIIRNDQNTSCTNTTEFLNQINILLNEYNEMISDKTNQYYSEYGYTVYITLIDRIGMNVNTTLADYEITYNVAGSILVPTFEDKTNSFLMKLSGQKGSTYITKILAYKFNKVWTLMDVDNSANPQIFDKTATELKNALTYQFNKGVYRFVFTDNFARTNTYFHEFGIASSQTGGTINYLGDTSRYSDGYLYTYHNVKYVYDSSVYNVLIAFTGETLDLESPDADTYKYVQQEVFYNSLQNYTSSELSRYGISSIITSGNTTTITFTGLRELSKYEIKTILASTATETEYTWGLEETNKDIVVYNQKFAIYTGIPNVNIRNLNGNTLDTSSHLNLTEDFELVTAWNATNKIDFNSRIVLKRTYTENGKVQPTLTYTVPTGTIINQPGDYIAYVINDLGHESNRITFTRGVGEITMYAVYAINRDNNSERKLVASSYVTIGEENVMVFNYYITDDYCSYRDAISNATVTKQDLNDAGLELVANTTAYKYIDVRVNSNLSIFAKFDKCDTSLNEGSTSISYPYVQYMIYSITNTTDPDDDPLYAYRYVRIFFLPAQSNETTLTEASVTNSNNTLSDNSNLASGNKSTIKSTDDSVNIFFSELNTSAPVGDTIYIDRYYNGTLMETIVVENNGDIEDVQIRMATVGQHSFEIRDLAGRTHVFADGSKKLQIYLINQIMFTVNNKTPINNQIFNEDVIVDIQYTLDNLMLYGSDLGITYTHNGIEYSIDNTQGEIVFSNPGYYSLKILGTTMLAGNDSSVTDQEISTIYNFVILNENNAMRSFSVSKGTGFRIEKIQKISSGVTTDITNTYTDNDALIWLTYAEQGNSKFIITLKAFDEITNDYNSFTFKLWINDIDEQTTLIISSIPAGTETKDKISINYNPGLLYSQIGNGYIMLNNRKILDINAESEEVVQTIEITEKGTYYLKIFAEDGSLIGSYKFTKKEPMSGTAKFIVIGVIGGVAVLVGLFFFIRRKGKYR